MFDTNVCIDLLRRQNEPLRRRMKRISRENLLMSSITLSELWVGVMKSNRPSFNEERLLDFVLPFRLLSFDDVAAEQYGWILADLEHQGLAIGPLDLLIAAHALSLGAVLVTDNVREFKRVPGLQVQNWRR